MKTPHEIAETAEKWSDDEWWHLEAAAFRGNRAMQLALAKQMPKALWRTALQQPNSNVFALILNGICMLTQLFVACILSPLLAVQCIVIAVRGFDPPMLAWQLGAASLSAAVSVAYPLFRARHQPTPMSEHKIVFVVVGTSVIQLISGLFAWRQDALEGSPYWLIAVGAAVLISAVTAVTLDPPRHTKRQTTAEDAAAQLDADTRTAVRNELSSAISRLSERGIIEPDAAQTARQLPLGALGATLGTERPDYGDINEPGAIFNG